MTAATDVDGGDDGAYYSDAEWAALMAEWREERWREILRRTGRGGAGLPDPREAFETDRAKEERRRRVPSDVDTGECEQCGGEILWARSERGNWTPLDPDPASGGGFALRDGRAVYRPGDRRGPRFRFHGLTCPAERDDA